jgi:hypothetical protein
MKNARSNDGYEFPSTPMALTVVLAMDLVAPNGHRSYTYPVPLELARSRVLLDLLCRIMLTPDRPPDLIPGSISPLNAFGLRPDLISRSTSSRALARRPLDLVSCLIYSPGIGTGKIVFGLALRVTA